MAGINKVIILGNLGRDPELTYTPGGMAVCKFSIATSRKKQDGTEITAWHRLTAFGKQAEIIAQYVSKGQQLYVEGELSYGQYEKDGQTHYTTDIMIREFTLIGSRSDQGQQQAQQQQYQPQHNQASAYSTPGYNPQPMASPGYKGGQQQFRTTSDPNWPTDTSNDNDVPF